MLRLAERIFFLKGASFFPASNRAASPFSVSGWRAPSARHSNYVLVGDDVQRWVILVIAILISVAGCGAQQQEAVAPATMPPNQQQAFHDCMKRKHQEYILPLGPEFVDTAAKQQDYDACVAQAKAAPSAAPSPSPTKP